MWEIGDIVVVQSNTLVGKAIRWVTKSWASHVCVFVGDGLFFEAKPSRAGVVSLERYKQKSYEIQVYRLKVSEAKRLDFVRALVSKAGRHYDFFQIAYLLFIHVFGLQNYVSVKTSKNRSICSEVIFEALQEVGIKWGSMKQSNVVPGDFTKWHMLERIK